MPLRFVAVAYPALFVHHRFMSEKTRQTQRGEQGCTSGGGRVDPLGNTGTTST